MTLFTHIHEFISTFFQYFSVYICRCVYLSLYIYIHTDSLAQESSISGRFGPELGEHDDKIRHAQGRTFDAVGPFFLIGLV